MELEEKKAGMLSGPVGRDRGAGRDGKVWVKLERLGGAGWYGWSWKVGLTWKTYSTENTGRTKVTLVDWVRKLSLLSKPHRGLRLL